MEEAASDIHRGAYGHQPGRMRRAASRCQDCQRHVEADVMEAGVGPYAAVVEDDAAAWILAVVAV